MKAELLADAKGARGLNYRHLPAGTIIEHPNAYQLVQVGIAKPADDECCASAGLTPEQAAEAQQGYRRVAAGIAPEDYKAFEAGEMTGYDGNGNPIPGPNFHEDYDLEDEDDDDE